MSRILLFSYFCLSVCIHSNHRIWITRRGFDGTYSSVRTSSSDGEINEKFRRCRYRQKQRRQLDNASEARGCRCSAPVIATRHLSLSRWWANRVERIALEKRCLPAEVYDAKFIPKIGRKFACDSTTFFEREARNTLCSSPRQDEYALGVVKLCVCVWRCSLQFLCTIANFRLFCFCYKLIRSFLWGVFF